MQEDILRDTQETNKTKQKWMLRVMIETGQLGERVREELFTVFLKL